MSKRTQQTDENGMVAIIVTLVMMIIITLVVSSFAVIVRREQRQSLDRELSTQAFYAAETGINNATYWLKKQLATGTVPAPITDCGAFPYADYNGGIIEGDTKYSCVLIDGTPTVLDYGSVNTDGSIIVPINTDVPTSRLKISWENTDQGSINSFSSLSSHALPQDVGLSTAVVEATIIEGFDGVTAKNRQDLINGSQTMFLYPNGVGGPGPGGSIAFAPGPNQSRQQQGDFVDGQCNSGNRSADAYACSVTISGLTKKNYYLRLKPMYQSTKFKISADSKQLSYAQAIIDVTGKATDVLRRLQVRVPIDESTSTATYDNFSPLNALESTGDICKRLLIIGTTSTNQCAVVTPPPGGGGGTSGDAAFSGCASSGCVPSSGGTGGTPEPYVWKHTFFNVSKVSDTSLVTGCEWDFGDGSPIIYGSPTNIRDGCLPGQQLRNQHTFLTYPTPVASNNCYKYTVTLTMHFSGGLADAKYSDTRDVPLGPEGKKDCAAGYTRFIP